MPQQSPKKADIVIARSKRTAEKYPARTSHLSGALSPTSSRVPYPHYTDCSRLQACRCLRAWEHQQAHPISGNDKNLANAITHYMVKYGLESCSVPTFYQHYGQQKISWVLSGKRATRFHYTSNRKAAVCRCTKPEHLSLRRVHSPEIQELCAGFFQLNMTETTCTREQWRAVDLTEIPQTSPISRPATVEPVRGLSTPRVDPFEYDSVSVVELLNVCEMRPRSSRKHHSKNSSHQHHFETTSDSRPRHLKGHSSPSVDMAYLSGGSNGEADLPENVWRVSRPSVYLGQHEYEQSRVSTPLGTSVMPSLLNTDLHIHHEDHRPSALDLTPYLNCGSSSSSTQYSYPHSSSSSGWGNPIKCSPLAHPASQNTRCYNPEMHTAIMRERPGETTRRSTICSSAAVALQDTEPVTRVIELPSPELAVELDSTPTYPRSLFYHSPTLRELEARSSRQVVELAGRPFSVQPRSTKEKKISSCKITHLIEQPFWDAKLPSQEDFFLRYVTVCSRTRPAPLEDCSLCHNSYHVPNKQTIGLTCGHYVHQECLISNFRSLDFEFGNCPVCGMAMCERTLNDRIDTDRGAIFGPKFTHLATEERIEFAQRSESVICWSEEEVAAAQLRLLKDYVDVHADELYRQWRQTAIEPDWYGSVVFPVVQLFKGWNTSTRRCRYFTDHDAFYKLVVWAELVRLMNTTYDALRKMHGQSTPFPQLYELYRRFMSSKDRYEVEKWKWQTNRSRLLDCEKVAQDAFSMAVSMQSDN